MNSFVHLRDRVVSLRTLNKIQLFLLFAIFLAACSRPFLAQAPDMYRFLDGRQKNIYLAYFADLQPDQQRELLESGGDFMPLLKAWKLEKKYFRFDSWGAAQFIAEPEHYTVKAIDIVTDPSEPIRTGTSLTLRAFLVMTDGRRTEITDDVIWSAEPSLARLKNNRLDFDCLASDVKVEAEFLGAKRDGRRIIFAKTVKVLDVHLAASSAGNLNTEYISMDATAVCQDGTTSNVNCQATWKTSTPSVASEGCGHFTVVARADSKERKEGIETWILTSYGELGVSTRLIVPGIRKSP